MKNTCLLAISFCLTTMFIACNNAKNSTTSSDTAVNATTEAAPATPTISITDKRWRLIELMSQPVADSVNGKVPFITFNNADSTYSASGGCNVLNGRFLLDEQTSRIEFKQGISTMMACIDMKVEDGLKNALNNADNFTLSGDSILSLNRARMAPLARFRAAQ